MHRQRFPDQRGADFGFGRRRIAAQQRFGRHDHARRAEAALRAELLVERALQPVEAALLARPSIVSMWRPSQRTASVMQDGTASPSTRTVQAPHSPPSQPVFTPVR